MGILLIPSTINRTVDDKTHQSNDQSVLPALHTSLQEGKIRGTRRRSSRMFTQKPMLMSEKVLFMVAGPMAAVLAIVAPVLSIS